MISLETDYPYILSASKCTDIPAFYMDWFMKRLELGYSSSYNPVHGVKTYISYKNIRFIVFWSKNPTQLLRYIDRLDVMGLKYYIQFTLNDYEPERLEPGLPPLHDRIDTFKRIADRLSPKHVIWRFDPLIITNNVTEDVLIDRINEIADKLHGYTEKLVFSFADISSYNYAKKNIENNKIIYKDWNEGNMLSFSKKISAIGKSYNLSLATCGEKIDIESLGIKHNKCIDDDLIIQLAHTDNKLMNFLGVKIVDRLSPGKHSEYIPLGNGTYAEKVSNCILNKVGKRLYCGCVYSRDIGEYSTCPHLCVYCYANKSKETVLQNCISHSANKFGDTISGK